MLDISQIKKIYFVGIGGIGMSAAAGLAADRGFAVSGCDAKTVYEPAKAVLDKFKIAYTIGYAVKSAEISADLAKADLVVVSAGIEEQNLELQEALRLGTKVISYPELLGALAADKKRIVVVGTNGKSSTSALLGSVLRNLNDSSFFIGGVLKEDVSNFYSGKGPEFVIEGDEYRAGYIDLTPKFLYYNPDVLLINNLELDHPDIYPDLERFKDAFKKLLTGMPSDGLVVYNADDQNVLNLIKEIPQKKIGFGFQNANAEIKGAASILEDSGLFSTRFKYQNSEMVFKSNFPGQLYAYNNLAAVSVLLALGYNFVDFAGLIQQYQGLKRRFEIISENNGITVIDDYAHHPTAVLATLTAARLKYARRRIIAVFEPHTYSRTAQTLPQLINAFRPADLVFISEVYPAREQKLPSSTTGRRLVDEISKKQPNVFFTPNQEATQKTLGEFARPGDVMVVMSVGPYKAI